MKNSTLTHAFMVRLSKEQLEKLDAIAALEDRSRAGVIRKLLRNVELENHAEAELA